MPNRRFRIAFLHCLAVLAQWDKDTVTAIAHLREAAALADDIGLPGERWQVAAALGELHARRGEGEMARAAYAEAAAVVRELAAGLGDELRAHFLAAPQVRRVLAHGRDSAAREVP